MTPYFCLRALSVNALALDNYWTFNLKDERNGKIDFAFVCFHDKPKNSKGNISNCIIQLNLKERKDSYVPCEKIIFKPY